MIVPIDQWRPGLCIGIDPTDWGREHAGDVVFAARGVARAYKLNYWAFATQSHMRTHQAIEAVVAHIRRHDEGKPIILDAKFGDVGHIARRQAEWAAKLGFDAVTLSPYNHNNANLAFSQVGLFTFMTHTDLTDLRDGPRDPAHGHVIPSDHNNGLTIAHAFRDHSPETWVLSPGYGIQGGTILVVQELQHHYFANVSRAISEVGDMAGAADYWADQLNPKDPPND